MPCISFFRLSEPCFTLLTVRPPEETGTPSEQGRSERSVIPIQLLHLSKVQKILTDIRSLGTSLSMKGKLES